MRALTHFTGRIPVNSRPQIVRLHDSLSIEMDFSCVMPFWSLHFFHSELRIDIEGEEHWLRPGLALLTPPGVHTLTYSKGGFTQYYAHFYLPEEPATVYAVAPMILDMEGEYDKINAVFGDAARSWRTNKEKAEIALWYIVQTLFVPAADSPAPDLPQKLAKAVNLINHELPVLSGVGHLSRRLGVSARHLNRLFQRQFGVTAAEFLREKRLLEAKRYLVSSEHLVKEIGPMVGIPGPQHFNAMIKKGFGLSPQALRRSCRLSK